MPTNDAIQIHTPSEVTAEWLTDTIGTSRISDSEYARIGTGQVSECYRFKLNYVGDKGPESIVLKVASTNDKSRHSGASLGLYEREVAFYREIAPNLPQGIPRCYHAAHYPETNTFCLLLEDAIGMAAGDDIVGATLEQAKACLTTMGRIHGSTLRSGVAQYPWLKRPSPLSQAVMEHLLAGFAARYQAALSREELDICARLVSSYDAYKEQQAELCIQGMMHGDFRLDNILLGHQSDHLFVVDWQTVTYGAVLADVAYFLGCALPTDIRRAHYEELVKTYHEALGPDTPLSLARCHEDLRRQTFLGIVMGVASPMLVEQTERGDKMFITMVKRHCALIQDLKAVDILPEPAILKPLQPRPEDEQLHPPTKEPLYNESYYFDVADPKQGVAAYLRLGITPNAKKGRCWLAAAICRRGKPLVAIMDYKAPIPDETLLVRTPSYTASHTVIDPLKVFNIKVSGQASTHSEPESIFRSEPGTEGAEISFDLTFHTDGTPYQYRVAPRYEIPCIVSGTIEVEGESYTISKQVGQRDHSWGERDWWGMDWLWSSLHFEDGTHLHLVDLDIKDRGKLGIGYMQKAGEEVLELSEISTESVMDDQSILAQNATLTFTPQGQSRQQVEVEAYDHGPLLLVSEKAAVSFFDRAWCKCTMQDGRVGYGWLEWNRVQQ